MIVKILNVLFFPYREPTPSCVNSQGYYNGLQKCVTEKWFSINETTYDNKVSICFTADASIQNSLMNAFKHLGYLLSDSKYYVKSDDPFANPVQRKHPGMYIPGCLHYKSIVQSHRAL